VNAQTREEAQACRLSPGSNNDGPVLLQILGLTSPDTAGFPAQSQASDLHVYPSWAYVDSGVGLGLTLDQESHEG
jgi:hypothetical protein